MPRTPDAFPGERLEEQILFDSGSLLPDQAGEVNYASGTLSGSGFFFNEEGRVAQVVQLPSQVGMIPFAVETSGKFIPALPITSTMGWLVNNQGILIVSASIPEVVG